MTRQNEIMTKFEIAVESAKDAQRRGDLAYGQWLRKRRREMCIPLRELARKLEVSAAFLSDVEFGKRHASMEMRVKLDEFIE